MQWSTPAEREPTLSSGYDLPVYTLPREPSPPKPALLAVPKPTVLKTGILLCEIEPDDLQWSTPAEREPTLSSGYDLPVYTLPREPSPPKPAALAVPKPTVPKTGILPTLSPTTLVDHHLLNTWTTRTGGRLKSPLEYLNLNI